jgi:hypothetical protein
MLTAGQCILTRMPDGMVIPIGMGIPDGMAILIGIVTHRALMRRSTEVVGTVIVSGTLVAENMRLS